jgi:hypothetical protein
MPKEESLSSVLESMVALKTFECKVSTGDAPLLNLQMAITDEMRRGLIGYATVQAGPMLLL